MKWKDLSGADWYKLVMTVLSLAAVIVAELLPTTSGRAHEILSHVGVISLAIHAVLLKPEIAGLIVRTSGAGLFMCLLACPAYAQHDDCPQGGTKHAALTALDHASMEAAVVASFRGIYHRDPSGVPGSGPDDIGYWIGTFDHYGPYGDSICRAGWNAYAEARLAGAASGDPTLGDQPARFLPVANVPSVVPPASTPLVTNSDAVLAAIADLKETMTAEHAEQTRTVGDALKSFGEFAIKYVAPAIGAYLAGHQMAK